MKKTLLILLLFFVSGVGCRSEAPTSVAPQYQIFRPTWQPITQSIQLVGKVSPKVSADVRAPIANKIESLAVRLGDRVKKGAVLGRYSALAIEKDISEKSRAVAAKRVELKNLRLQIQALKKRSQRATYLYKRKIGSRQDMEDAKRDLVTAQNSLNVTEQDVVAEKEQLKTLKKTKKRLSLVSPISGVVVSLWIGTKTFVPGTSVQEGELLMSIARLDRLVVNAAPSEADALKIRRGLPVKIVSDSQPNSAVIGRVEKTFSVPITDPQTGLSKFPMEISVNNRNSFLRIGMTVNCSIELAKKQRALVVPLSAVKYDSDNFYVEIFNQNIFEKRFVQLGISNDMETEILSGISEQDLIKVN